MKKFIGKLLLLALLCSGLFLCINEAYRTHQINLGTMGTQKNDDAWVESKAVPAKITLCNFGSSHGYYSFCYDACENSDTCFNFALPSQSLSYDYRILREYREHIAEGAVVVICVSYNSLYGYEETAGADFAAKNKRYYHFLSPANIKEYDSLTELCVTRLPSLTSPDLADLVSVTLGLNREEDLWSIETDAQTAPSQGQRKYETHVARNVNTEGVRVVNREEVQALYDLISLCRELGAVPVLVTTPYLSEYVDAIQRNDPAFFPDFAELLGGIIEDTGVLYDDYSRDARFSSDYTLFMNTDHLNRSGALLFTQIILSELECL